MLLGHTSRQQATAPQPTPGPAQATKVQLPGVCVCARCWVETSGTQLQGSLPCDGSTKAQGSSMARQVVARNYGCAHTARIWVGNVGNGASSSLAIQAAQCGTRASHAS